MGGIQGLGFGVYSSVEDIWVFWGLGFRVLYSTALESFRASGFRALQLKQQKVRFVGFVVKS